MTTTTTTATTPLPAPGPSDADAAIFARTLYHETGPGRPDPYWDAIVYPCLAAAVAHEAAVRPGATLADVAHAVAAQPIDTLLALWSQSPSPLARATSASVAHDLVSLDRIRGAVATDLSARLRPFIDGATTEGRGS